jgi:hypothetical protein
MNARPAERSLLAETFAAQKLWVWQKRLGLQDWKVTLHVVRLTELKPKTLGNIHWDRTTKTASVNILDPADYKLPLPAILDDLEFTVVHELIHLHLSSLPRNEASRTAEEEAANRIAEALLALERRK